MFEVYEKMFITIGQGFVDVTAQELIDRGIPNTPENRIKMYEQLLETMQENAGESSLMVRVMTAMAGYYIDQDRMQMQVLGNTEL